MELQRSERTCSGCHLEFELGLNEMREWGLESAMQGCFFLDAFLLFLLQLPPHKHTHTQMYAPCH